MKNLKNCQNYDSLNTLTAAIVYTASVQPARHGNTSRPKKLCKLQGWV